MLLFNRAKENNHESQEVEKARKYLKSIYKSKKIFQSKSFDFLRTVRYKGYIRYYFCEKRCKDNIYIVLSPEERNKIEKDFERRMSAKYKYAGTILHNDQVRHRFLTKADACALPVFLTDDGNIWAEGIFEG